MNKFINDPHYHSTEKGCKFHRVVRKDWEETENFTCKFCEVHKIETCRCGWEWGWHHGTDSRKIQKENKYYSLMQFATKWQPQPNGSN